ncbi:hypothetical protein K1T71_005245 [Dendrolimus kikuchii]|uniref:Uncharacterized protein n=1 Tax=Dendrolimus kikuchii TaxID=765133 RepID=A0ACC1D7G1_9NEOP|nr:hypothetical protein K1T71_005245 [Dendrolimus kikuchii]
MSDEWMEFTKDTRPICKYGVKCYQKNPEHHETYKHPPQINKKAHVKTKTHRFKPYSKKETPKRAKNDEEQTSKDSKETKSKDGSPRTLTSSPEINLEIEIRNISINLPDNLTYYDKNSDHSIIKELFLTEMPKDFFKFFEFLNDGGKGIEKDLASVNLELIGPYDLLLGKLPVLDDKELYLIHGRFFFDPPEFQAVLKKKGKSQYHIGYFRDSPDDIPEFLASNDSEKDYVITPMAENIFAATYLYLQNEKKSSPFIAIACQKLLEKIKKYADDNDYSLEQYDMKKRKSKMLTATFHRAGIVVPYDKKSQLGYRPLVETDANLKKLFKNVEKASTQNEKDKILSELQPVITYSSIAMDECDFGTGLEAGVALFCSGLKELESSTLSSFNVAYTLLKREAFGKIIQAHMKYRRKGPDMSLLSSSKK